MMLDGMEPNCPGKAVDIDETFSNPIPFTIQDPQMNGFSREDLHIELGPTRLSVSSSGGVTTARDHSFVHIIL